MADKIATSESDVEVGSTELDENASTSPRPVSLDSASLLEQYTMSCFDGEDCSDWPRPPDSTGPNDGHTTSGSRPAATFGYRPPGADLGSGQDPSFAAPRQPEQTFSTKPLTPPAKPAAPPKRPKGRFFVSVILFALIATGAYSVWNSALRYAAYGTVDGRVIHVAAPWGGIVQSLHVREGATVSQGELLVTLQNLELQQQLEEIGDQLKIGQADIEAEIARHRLLAEVRGDQSQKAIAEYYEMWGRLLEEQARLTTLETRLNRLGSLRKQNVISDEEWDTTRFATAGQRAKVNKLKTAVGQLRARSEPAPDQQDEVVRELQPQLARLKNLQARLPRLRAQVEQGKIRSPVGGRVVKRNIFVGEYADKAKTVVEVLEEDSLEIVLYMSQRRASRLTVGNSVPLTIEPNVGAVMCHVVRVGDRLGPVPEELGRYYRSGENLLPVYFQPQYDQRDNIVLRLGTEVKLPHTWNDTASQSGLAF